MVSAIEILRRLPVVFTDKDFLRMTKQRSDVAQVVLSRLRSRDLIQSAGPRSSVYFNLLKDPKAAENRVLEAVKRIYPSAVVVGAAVLHAHGWTTQIPQVAEVAVLTMRTHKLFHGVKIVNRPQKWFVELAEKAQLLHRGDSPFLIESVTPQFALEDARKHQDVWLPDEDDLDVPDEDVGVHNGFHA